MQTSKHPAINAVGDSAPGTSWADTFDANPRLAVATLVRDMNRNAGVEPAIRPDLTAALDRAAEGTARTGTAVRPRSLPGGITRNRTSSRTSGRKLSFAPPPAELAALMAGEHLAHDLLASGMPASLAGQADAIAHFADPIYRAWSLHRLERRGVQSAEAAARHFISHGQPCQLVFARTGHLTRWHAEQLERLHPEDRADDLAAGVEDQPGTDANAVADSAARVLRRRPRLAWMHHDGPHRGLLLDRFHHTHLRGAIERDSWTRGKVTEDLATIDAFLAPAYTTGQVQPGVANLGVRVHAHRAPNVGIHFLPDYAGGGGRPVPGGHHRLGGCEHCATVDVLPNSHLVAGRVAAQTGGPR